MNPTRRLLLPLMLLSLPIAAVHAQGQSAGPGPSHDKGQATDNQFKHADSTLSNDTMVSDTSKRSPDLADSDLAFFQAAAVSGMTEVAAGKLAATHAKGTAVKQYASHLVTDHSKANEQLATLAVTKVAPLPQVPDDAHQAKLDALAKLNGTAFDKAYLADMKQGHEDTIALFKRGAQSKDKDIAAFAQTTLPTLEHHLAMLPKDGTPARKHKKKAT